MRKWSIFMCLALTLLTARTVYAVLNWEGEYFEFVYDVEMEGTVFNKIAFDWDQLDGRASCDTTTCLYSNIAETTAFSDKWDFIETEAGALGSGASTSPPDGLLVKGYAEMNLNGFDPDNHGVLLRAEANGIDVLSTVSRRFSVDAEEEYVLGASIRGAIDFNVFGSRSISYFSSYVVSGTVSLEKYVVDEFGFATSLGVVATLLLNDKSRPAQEEVLLVPKIDGDEIVYQLVVDLKLRTELQNLVFPSTIKLGPPPFVGPFKVGSSVDPIELRGFLRKSGAMPWIPLLLLDDQV